MTSAAEALRLTIWAFSLALPISIAGTNIAAGFMTALLLLTMRQVRPAWNTLWNPTFGALLLYCAIAALAGTLGVDPSRSFQGFFKDLHKIWIFSLLWLTLAAQPSPRAHRALGLGFAFMALAGIVQSLTQRDDGGHWTRAHGFVHAVTYGQQMALGLLGGLCFLVRCPNGRRRLAYLGLIALTGAALILSQTRSAFLGLGAGFAALCALERRFRRQALWGAATLAAGLILSSLLPTNRSLTRDWLSPNYDLFMPQLHRISLWNVALDIFKDHPWLGVGPGNYRTVFSDYRSVTIEGEKAVGSAHNLYFHQLAERGLIGLSVLVVLLYALTRQAWARAASRPNPCNLWAWSSCVAFLVMNLTEVSFQNEQLSTLFLFIWTWAEANRKTDERAPINAQ